MSTKNLLQDPVQDPLQAAGMTLLRNPFGKLVLTTAQGPFIGYYIHFHGGVSS